ncbi:MAG: malto-oligosyltrehalose synthase [Gemmatimonadetes bacterium]|nr:malto-oligosyltrehalose synthase [Gemmatimonadota bacterium]
MSTNIKQPVRVPNATYRFQFNRHFTFRDATELVPYLATLGISDLYASPYLLARPGSLHGYDIFNHNELNPEIGSTAEHAEMVQALREHGMGHLLDIVPNHMGIAESSNRWWMDVLENGPSSPYARFFDIDWHPLKRELEGKVLLPVLGDQFGDVLERGELQLRYEEGRFRIEYYESHFPVAPKSTSTVLRETLAVLDSSLDAEHLDRLELESIVTALEHLPPRDRPDAISVAERRREKMITQRRLATLTHESPEVRGGLEKAVTTFNGTVGEPHSFDRLQHLLDDQAYRLAFWRVAAEEINYRRFFDINDLAGLRVERDEVFAETHRLILRLVEEGMATGLRIDHPDGLFDPRGYLQRLQEEAQRASGDGHFYLLVEKILTGDEELPVDWPVAGTVGYDLMDRLNRVFVAAENEAAMDDAYTRFVRRTPEFEELIYGKKKLILRSALASELNVMAHLLNRLSERNRRSRDFTLGSLREALREVIACFPIYRTYVDARTGHVSDRDREYVEQATRVAIRRNRATNVSVFNFVRDTLLLRWPDMLDAAERAEHAEFVMKFQQLTGPVMAKGVEDTSFYIFNRLISLNEVGGEPDRFGLDLSGFHQYVARRAEQWPHAMNATSTHDTKRSEDVRARIHVLSEIPAIWSERVARWAEMNAAKRPTDDGKPIPDRNDEYLLYQTLVGAWPIEAMDEESGGSFVERIQQYMEKATREAKVHTSWINPNEEYDSGLREFIARILKRSGENEFPSDFRSFHAEHIAVPGMRNALAQLLLKLTLPGIPDIYQGQEIWDLSLVDPDNRRPVDYALRRKVLEEIRGRLETGARGDLAADLVREWQDGRIKMYLTHLALELRVALPELFQSGEYQPLNAVGEHAAHVIAFARQHDGKSVVVAVPRLLTKLATQSRTELPSADSWGDTRVAAPGTSPSLRYRNVLTGAEIEPVSKEESPSFAAGDLFRSFPVALLKSI